MTDSAETDIAALVLAAGFSSRMHGFKPLLPCNDTPMVETVIALFKACGIHDIVVVTGHNHETLAPVIENRGGRPVLNPGFKAGMLSSIQKGTAQIPDHADGFFLLPVDIPAVRPATVRLMIQAFQENPSRIVMPCFNGTTGHPPLIPARFREEILGLDEKSTLRDLFSARKDRVLPLDVFDRGILMDADDREGYKQVCEKRRLLDTPDEAECYAIIDAFLPAHPEIRAHMESVSAAALKIAGALAENLDMGLVRAGALLHDIKRLEKNHAAAGAALLQHMGFGKVAHIVAQHMDIGIDPAAPVEEKEVVYFADKIHRGREIDLNYGARFEKSLEKFFHAKTHIVKRYENTERIQARIEKSAGRSVKDILTV